MKARKILSMIMALAMVISMMSVGVYAADVTEVSTYGELVDALAAGDEVKLTADITAEGKVSATDAKVDLNGYKLTLADNANNYFLGTSFIKNGTISIDGVEVGGDCIVGIGNRSADGTLSLENVNVTGSNYSSAFAVFMVYGNGTLNVSGGEIDLSNELSSAGGIFKNANGAGASGNINITGTKIDGDDISRGISGATVILDDVNMTLTGGDNGINGSKLTVKNSEINISGGTGRALTVTDYDVVIENSSLNFADNKEADIRFKTANTITTDGKTEIKECNVFANKEGAKINDKPVIGTEEAPDTVTVAEGTTTVEEYQYPAFIGDKGYVSFEAALEAAEEGAVIDLLGNEVVLGATLNADKNITIKNGTLDATAVEFEQFGVSVGVGKAITFENVDFVLDSAKAHQGFFYNEGTVTFNGGSVVADGTDAPAIFHGGELETAGKFVINGTEITLSALVNGDEGGRGFLYPTLDIDDATITMTDLTDNAMRSVAGTVDNSIITVDGAEYGIKNKGFDGVLTVTNSEITISNTQNEDGANAGIYLESEEGLLADENSVINSSMYIPATEEDGEPTIYYVLSFVNCELTHVQELNGTEIDLADYIPSRDGYTFSGWYTDADCTEGNEIDIIVLDADITVYAAWTKNRTSGNGGLQAGGDTSNKGADDLGQKDDAEDKTEEQTPVTPVTPAAHPFADVNSGDWYNAAVEYVYKNGLMNGTAEDKFSPNATLTRAMLVTVLYRAEGSPATNKSIPFGDVDMGAYYADAVIWAKQNGIVNGVTENDFAPNANITREQIAAIMHRYAQYKGYNVAIAAELTGFADAKNVSAYAVDAMKYAVGAGIINGKTATTVNPAEFATRAELATILMRFIENNK